MLLPIILSTVVVIFGVTAEDESGITPQVVVHDSIQVSIQFQGKSIGVGVIIHPQFVLTLWSLLDGKPKNEIKVIVVSGNPPYARIPHNVRDIVSTVGYVYGPYEVKHLPRHASRPIHDITLIRIDGNFNLGPTSHLASAPIPDKTFQPAQDVTTDVHGFDYQLKPSIVFLPLIKTETCNETYQNRGGIFDGEICAGGKGTFPNGAALCDIDEGTPLISGGLLIGIATGIVDCGSLTYPYLFTDIVRHSDWIRGSMANMLQNGDEWFKPTWEDAPTWRWLKRPMFGDPPVCEIGPQKQKIADDVCHLGCNRNDMNTGGCSNNQCWCKNDNGYRRLWDVMNNIDP